MTEYAYALMLAGAIMGASMILYDSLNRIARALLEVAKSLRERK